MDGVGVNMGEWLKKKIFRYLESLGEYITLLGDVIKSSLKTPPPWSEIRDQIYNIGVLSFNVIVVTGLSTGVILASQSFYQLSEKGLTGVTGIMVSKAMITELGPILTSLMITGRIGSAMCAELGTMKVTEQIDAMETMAVDPNSYLIAPRFIGGIFMIPLLTVFSMALGIFGGYLISVFFFGMSRPNYFDPMPVNISMFDINTGIIKSLFFGITLTTICCYKGIKTKGGAAGVGKATTDSVVISYITILISDFLLNIALNSLHKEFGGLFK